MNVALRTPVRVMIIDDVRVNLKILASLVESMGYEAVTFLSAKEAMGAVERILPHLILLDVLMPDLDGFQFCRLIKKNVKTKEIPVIFISALGEAADKEKGFQAGAVDYIAHPFERSEVISRVSVHVRMYEMSKQLENYNSRLNKLVIEQNLKIEEEKKKVLYALSKIAESGDERAVNHLANIQYNCRLLAQCLQFSPKYEREITNLFIDTIESAAVLHDIGNLFISDKVLLKPARLDAAERLVMETHVKKGSHLLYQIIHETEDDEFLNMAADIAAYHHENWDGTGYPNGLSGNEIPLAARVVHIVDVYDALTSARCYKKAYSEEESFLIMKESIKNFDPEIFHIFTKIRKQFKTDESLTNVSCERD